MSSDFASLKLNLFHATVAEAYDPPIASFANTGAGVLPNSAGSASEYVVKFRLQLNVASAVGAKVASLKLKILNDE